MQRLIVDWVMSGSAMSSAIYAVKKEEKPLSNIRLLKSEEIDFVVREGRVENPIEVCDDSDEGGLSCDESLSNNAKYSVSGMNEIEAASDFDADVVLAEGIEIFESMKKENNVDEKSSFVLN